MHEAERMRTDDWVKGYAGEVTREPITTQKTLIWDRLLTWNML